MSKQKNSNIKLLNGACTWKASVDLETYAQFLVHIIQTEKRSDIVAWSNSKKSVLVLKLTVPWEENREKAHQRKKYRSETLCADCVEKRLDMPCGSYWGWLTWFSRTLSHFVSFKNRNHWLQFESCLISSSDYGAICMNLDLAESGKSSAWMKCTRNQHSRVITSHQETVTASA